ncbi:MAG: type II toxin-antitoxin system RelE/ParE family toxin [Ignavibacteria bacterium]|nr:type II toxin-antitoxin system RelE/ParE family toxin [Ignavibacteria bacterium]
MAQKIIWTHEAANDLEAIAEFIGKDSLFYAASFVQRILTVSRSIFPFPLRGRIVPEFSTPNIKELFVKEYRLIYRVEETSVTILGIIHGKRDLKTLWKDEQRQN